MTEKTNDVVNHPRHYQLPGLELEWIDVKHALFQTIPSNANPEVIAFWSETMNYLGRMWQKNGKEDAEKAQFYLNRMLTLDFYEEP